MSITIPAHKCTEAECCSFGGASSASCGCHKTHEQVQADLIEIMLAALKAIAEGCSFPADDVQRACRDRARAAIAKAEGADAAKNARIMAEVG
jgi:hypothetical protein